MLVWLSFSWLVMTITLIPSDSYRARNIVSDQQKSEESGECLFSDSTENFHPDIKRNSGVSYMSDIAQEEKKPKCKPPELSNRIHSHS